jgi:hypothetical protein
MHSCLLASEQAPARALLFASSLRVCHVFLLFQLTLRPNNLQTHASLSVNEHAGGINLLRYSGNGAMPRLGHGRHFPRSEGPA